MITPTIVVTAILGCAAIIPGCTASVIESATTANPVIEVPARPICEQDEEGYVWQFYTDDDFGCDVVAGQTLALTGTPGQQECDDMGGYAYIAYTDIDPDDNWDDSAYGDCFGVNF